MITCQIPQRCACRFPLKSDESIVNEVKNSLATPKVFGMWGPIENFADGAFLPSTDKRCTWDTKTSHKPNAVHRVNTITTPKPITHAGCSNARNIIRQKLNKKMTLASCIIVAYNVHTHRSSVRIGHSFWNERIPRYEVAGSIPVGWCKFKLDTRKGDWWL